MSEHVYGNFWIVDTPAAEFHRRRQPKTCRAAAAGKNSVRHRRIFFGTPRR